MDAHHTADGLAKGVYPIYVWLYCKMIFIQLNCG